MSKVYVGDTGTLVELDTGADLSTATLVNVKAKKPDGTAVTWVATVSGTTVRYTTLTADFDQHGGWTLQAYVEMPTGRWTGEAAALTVYPAFG
jgi:hypothetical protein